MSYSSSVMVITVHSIDNEVSTMWWFYCWFSIILPNFILVQYNYLKPLNFVNGLLWRKGQDCLWKEPKVCKISNTYSSVISKNTTNTSLYIHSQRKIWKHYMLDLKWRTGKLLEAIKRKDRDCVLQPPEECSLVNTLIPAKWDSFQTADINYCKIIPLCCFKPLRLWGLSQQ